MNSILLLLLASFGSAVPVDYCDLIELNHLHDEQGRHVFDQLVYWDFRFEQAAYVVRAWRLQKTPEQIPQRDFERGGYVARWHDNDTLRVVRAKQFRETWTTYDPELANREIFPKDMRRELTRGEALVPAKFKHKVK